MKRKLVNETQLLLTFLPVLRRYIFSNGRCLTIKTLAPTITIVLSARHLVAEITCTAFKAVWVDLLQMETLAAHLLALIRRGSAFVSMEHVNLKSLISERFIIALLHREGKEM